MDRKPSMDMVKQSVDYLHNQFETMTASMAKLKQDATVEAKNLLETVSNSSWDVSNMYQDLKMLAQRDPVLAFSAGLAILLLAGLVVTLVPFLGAMLFVGLIAAGSFLFCLLGFGLVCLVSIITWIVCTCGAAFGICLVATFLMVGLVSLVYCSLALPYYLAVKYNKSN
jgi:uncharacterized protein YaaW (UPF0174 family)